MNKQKSHIPKSSDLIVGQPIYQPQPPRQAIRIPIYERPLYPIPHSHSHTTVFVPMAPTITVPLQTKVIRPPPIVSIKPTARIPTYLKEENFDVQKRRIEHQTPKFAYGFQKSETEEQRNQGIIRDLLRQNKLVKQENEELRIQNYLLIQKIQNLNRKIDLQQKYREQDKAIYQTDTDSAIHDGMQNRMKRAKSFQFFKQFQTNQFRTPQQEQYYGPSVIKCCDKCAKCVFENKDNKNQNHSQTQRFHNQTQRVQNQTQRIHKYMSRQKQCYKTDYDDKHTRVVEKIKQPQTHRRREKQYSSRQEQKSQDVNTLIKRLKQQNKLLKKMAIK